MASGQSISLPLDIASDMSLKDGYVSIQYSSCACLASSTSLLVYIDSFCATVLVSIREVVDRFGLT